MAISDLGCFIVLKEHMYYPLAKVKENWNLFIRDFLQDQKVRAQRDAGEEGIRREIGSSHLT